MDWKELIAAEIEEAYKATDGLMAMVTDDELDWKPGSGQNWMTLAQLLDHLTVACGGNFRGFVAGDWDLPDNFSADMPPEEMLPPTETLPAVATVSEARRRLAADQELALEMLRQSTAKLEEPAPAPWDPRPLPLGQQLLGMVAHLSSHKDQLFFYLKLQGKPVNTLHLYGMA